MSTTIRAANAAWNAAHAEAARADAAFHKAAGAMKVAMDAFTHARAEVILAMAAADAADEHLASLRAPQPRMRRAA